MEFENDRFGAQTGPDMYYVLAILDRVDAEQRIARVDLSMKTAV